MATIEEIRNVIEARPLDKQFQAGDIAANPALSGLYAENLPVAQKLLREMSFYKKPTVRKDGAKLLQRPDGKTYWWRKG